MVYNRPLTLNVGSAFSGLVGTLSVAVVSPDGTIQHLAQTTSDITEDGAGSYIRLVPFNSAWGWVIVKWAAPGLSREETINAADSIAIATGSSGGAEGVPPEQCSFEPTLPSAKDRLRVRIGDSTGRPRWWFADASIVAVLDVAGTESEAAARLLESMAATCNQLAMVVDQVDIRRQYADRARNCMTLAKQIRESALPETAGTAGSPVAIGSKTLPKAVSDLVDYING